MMKNWLKGKFRMHVPTRKDSERVQQAFFKAGGSWCSGDTEITNIDSSYLYFDDGDMTVGDTRVYFEDSSSKEITLKDVFGKQAAPKAPTYLVIWDEEDEDPCKLFTTKPEANDFIKELSEKSSVIKNSILLVEIKSCKKIVVEKRLRFREHKI